MTRPQTRAERAWRRWEREMDRAADRFGRVKAQIAALRAALDSGAVPAARGLKKLGAMTIELGNACDAHFQALGASKAAAEAVEKERDQK